MTASFTGNRSVFLAEDYVIPDSPKELSVRLREYFNDLSAALNQRDIGLYATEETINGQLWLPTTRAGTNQAATNLVYRQVLRKVVETGTLSTGANAVAHGITVGATTHFTRIYGVIENAGTLYVPIPNNTILVTVDPTNVNINIPGAYNNYVGHVVLEWVTVN